MTSLLRLVVAHKRRSPKTGVGLCAVFKWKIAICLIASRSRRVEHWYTTTPTGSFSGLHQKPPVQLPHQVSPGSVFCIALQFAFLPQIFRATDSADQNQRALHCSIVRAPPFPKQYAQRRNLWTFLNNVAEAPQAGKLRISWFIVCFFVA